MVALGAIVELNELIDYEEYCRELDSTMRPQEGLDKVTFWPKRYYTIKHPSGLERHKFKAWRAPRPDSYGPIPIKIMLNEYGGLGELSGEPGISALEFADLSDGCRIGLRDGRSWSHWPLNTPDSQWASANGHQLANEAILMLDPDDNDDNDDWERWIVEELRQVGIEADPTSVHAAPYRIEFGPRLQDMLRQPKPWVP